jgi:glycosyltransferase involved in cell wall biosynthesis
VRDPDGVQDEGALVNVVHVCVAGTQPLLAQDGGAIQRRIIELAKAQVGLGHDVTSYSVGPTDRQTSVEGAVVRWIRCSSPMPWRHGEYLARLAMIIRRSPRPAILTFHGQPEGSVLGKIFRCPSALIYDYFRYRGGQYPILHKIYERMLRSFDLLLPCSRYCMEESIGHWGLEETKVSVLYNGVNLAQFYPDQRAGTAERKRLGLTGPIVLYVGRVNQQKGTDLLLRSWRDVQLRLPHASLVIAGPISQFGTPVRRSEEASWAKRIAEVGGRYLGSVDESRLAATYNMADVFVMPTRESEMFGMAAVEAQACGVPVVASDHGGLRETVPRRCGGRFPTGDADALGEQLYRLLTEPSRRADCGKAAAENAAQYGWDRIAKDLDDAYARAGIRE